MLQTWEGEDGAKNKDRLERTLQRLVYAGRLLLDETRRAIYSDWQAAYRTYVAVPVSAVRSWRVQAKYSSAGGCYKTEQQSKAARFAIPLPS